jgi:hypothetical protein
MGPSDNGLLDWPCDEMRLRHHLVRTEETHADRVKRCTYFHSARLPPGGARAATPTGIAVC